MRKKAIITALALALLLTAILSGCGGNGNNATETAAPVLPDETETGTETESETGIEIETGMEIGTETESETGTEIEIEPETGKQDGERFETVIMIEGMEETVQYEHVKNDAIGFEMDYDYNSLERYSEPERERFISPYDDPQDPWNYLEVTYSAENADTVSASVRETLSGDYDRIEQESYALDQAGECIKMDAFDVKDGAGTLQTVYIIPASDGCRVVTAHYTLESAEGFGTRFHYLMQTFSVIPRN